MPERVIPVLFSSPTREAQRQQPCWMNGRRRHASTLSAASVFGLTTAAKEHSPLLFFGLRTSRDANAALQRTVIGHFDL